MIALKRQEKIAAMLLEIKNNDLKSELIFDKISKRLKKQAA